MIRLSRAIKCVLILFIAWSLVKRSRRFLNTVKKDRISGQLGEKVLQKAVENNMDERVQTITTDKKPSASIDTKDTNKNVIIVLAYARTGSSFLGTLMSEPDRAAYFYEPLKILERPWKMENSVWAERSKELLDGLVNCNKTILKRIVWRQHQLYFQMIYKGVRDCPKRDPFIVKTIRLHKETMFPWILQTNFKIIHLVRDPRASLSSLFKEPEFWGKSYTDAEILCSTMREDLKLDQLLPKNRYIRTRYEDLVENTESELRRLYEFSSLAFTDSTSRLIYNLTHTEIRNTSAEYKGGYFMLYRGKTFKHDSWKTNLTSETIEKVQSVCEDVLDSLHYDLIKKAEPQS